MVEQLEWNYVLVTVIGTLGLLMSGLLYVLNKQESFTARLLAILIFLVTLSGMNTGLMLTNFYLLFPHFWRITVFTMLCVPPLSYLYVRSILKQQYRLEKTDYLFLLPAIAYTLCYIPFYLLPATEKRAIIHQLLDDMLLIAKEPESILPQGWGIMLRLLYSFSFPIIQIIMLQRYKKRVLDKEMSGGQNAEIYQWLYFFTISLFVLYLLLIFWHTLQLTDIYDFYQLITLTIFFFLLSVSLYLFKRPNILYGLKGWFQPQLDQQVLEQIDSKSLLENEERTFFDRSQEIELKDKLENHFLSNRPFIKTGYKIRDLSDELGIPIYLISAFINQQYGKNFNELINEYRINYVSDLLKTSPESHQYTFEAISREAGFNSRKSFINAVKKKTGKTPSEYFGRLDEENLT